jgi:hypothetical protein
MDGKEFHHGNPEILEIRNLIHKSGKGPSFFRAHARIGPCGEPFNAKLVDDKIVDARTCIHTPVEGCWILDKPPKRRLPICGTWPGGRGTTVFRREIDGKRERIQEYFLSIKAVAA